MFLTPIELQSLTGRVRRGAQVAALRAMGIEHRVRPDGRVVVSKSHVEHILGGSTPTRTTLDEPNWAALDAA